MVLGKKAVGVGEGVSIRVGVPLYIVEKFPSVLPHSAVTVPVPSFLQALACTHVTIPVTYDERRGKGRWRHL